MSKLISLLLHLKCLSSMGFSWSKGTSGDKGRKLSAQFLHTSFLLTWCLKFIRFVFAGLMRWRRSLKQGRKNSKLTWTWRSRKYFRKLLSDYSLGQSRRKLWMARTFVYSLTKSCSILWSSSSRLCLIFLERPLRVGIWRKNWNLSKNWPGI